MNEFFEALDNGNLAAQLVFMFTSISLGYLAFALGVKIMLFLGLIDPEKEKMKDKN